MAIEKGSAFLLKIGDGAEPPAFATMAGLRTTQLSINGETVVVTSKDSGGWRELLSGAGVRHVSVAGAGVFTVGGHELSHRETVGLGGPMWAILGWEWPKTGHFDGGAWKCHACDSLKP